MRGTQAAIAERCDAQSISLSTPEFPMPAGASTGSLEQFIQPNG